MPFPEPFEPNVANCTQIYTNQKNINGYFSTLSQHIEIHKRGFVILQNQREGIGFSWVSSILTYSRHIVKSRVVGFPMTLFYCLKTTLQPSILYLPSHFASQLIKFLKKHSLLPYQFLV